MDQTGQYHPRGRRHHGRKLNDPVPYRTEKASSQSRKPCSFRDHYFSGLALQHELKQLTPVGDDELEKTANPLENFAEHWERLEGHEEGRHELVKLIVDRVYVEDETVVALTLKSNCHLVLDHNAKEPTSHEVDPYLVFLLFIQEIHW